MADKKKYDLVFNWNIEDLNVFLGSNKLKMLNYISGKMDSQNKVINGDGIDSLASLIVSGDKAEIVMIDPPYNENKSQGKYKDQWRGSGKDFIWAGDNHGAYMDFLYLRLILGREILTEDGLMMLFIGDGEAHYVRVLMDKVFGEGNYVGTVIWDSSSNQQKSKVIDRNHEYVLIFAKNINKFSELGLYKVDSESLNSELFNKAQSLKNNGKTYNENQLEYFAFYKETVKKAKELGVNLSNFRYILPESYVPFYCDNAGDPRNGQKKQLKHPITEKPTPVPRGGKGYAFSLEYLENVENNGVTVKLFDGRVLKILAHPIKEDIKGIVFGENESGVPNTCRMYSLKTDKKVMTTTGWSFKGDKKEGIDPKTGFETVKPIEFLVELLLNYPNKNARVIDYFAGSGTTAVAVDKANKIDGGKRNWTMVELNESTFKNVLIPKLTYFGINDFKAMNVSAINLGKDEIDKFFRKFLLSYIQSEREYTPIEKDSSLGYRIVGVEKDTLILATVQKSEEQNSPRPSIFTKEIESYLTRQIKKIYVYLVGSDQYRSAWDALVKDTVVNKTKIAAKDIKIAPIQHELKAKWEGLIDTLSQYDDQKKG